MMMMVKKRTEKKVRMNITSINNSKIRVSSSLRIQVE